MFVDEKRNVHIFTAKSDSTSLCNPHNSRSQICSHRFTKQRLGYILCIFNRIMVLIHLIKLHKIAFYFSTFLHEQVHQNLGNQETAMG